MKISDVDLLKLVPEFMRDDPAVKGLATAMSEILREPGAAAKTARVWDQIDSLTDSQLDELAYELDIDWYSSDLPIETKRAIVKSSDLVHSRRGTKWAVEQVMADIFRGGTAQEWFEYGGQPFHFRVITNYPLDSQSVIEEFRRLVAVTKPARAILDTIEFAHVGTVTEKAATAAMSMIVSMSGVAGDI